MPYRRPGEPFRERAFGRSGHAAARVLPRYPRQLGRQLRAGVMLGPGHARPSAPRRASGGGGEFGGSLLAAAQGRDLRRVGARRKHRFADRRANLDHGAQAGKVAPLLRSRPRTARFEPRQACLTGA